MPKRPGRPRRGRVSEPAVSAVVETTVFRSGNSDAIRLPARFGFRGLRVYLRRLPDGRVVIEPRRKRRWPVGFLESFGRATPDFEPPPRSAPDEARDSANAAIFDDDDSDESE